MSTLSVIISKQNSKSQIYQLIQIMKKSFFLYCFIHLQINLSFTNKDFYSIWMLCQIISLVHSLAPWPIRLLDSFITTAPPAHEIFYEIRQMPPHVECNYIQTIKPLRALNSFDVFSLDLVYLIFYLMHTINLKFSQLHISNVWMNLLLILM